MDKRWTRTTMGYKSSTHMHVRDLTPHWRDHATRSFLDPHNVEHADRTRVCLPEAVLPLPEELSFYCCFAFCVRRFQRPTSEMEKPRSLSRCRPRSPVALISRGLSTAVVVPRSATLYFGGAAEESSARDLRRKMRVLGFLPVCAREVCSDGQRGGMCAR